MRSNKKSAPAIAGTIRRSKGLCGNPSTYLTTRGSARSSIVAGGMTPVLLRAAGGALLAAMAAAASFLPLAEASADSPAWEPEVVFMGLASDEAAHDAPAPTPASGIEIPVDQGDAEILAKLLWSSPLENEDEKRLLCWLVFNRIDDERYGIFGATVDTVVIRREFTWYDRKAYISETNIRIAMEELRRWQLYLIGAVKERLLPSEYVYAGFNGHHVQFYDQIGGEPWKGS